MNLRRFLGRWLKPLIVTVAGGLLYFALGALLRLPPLFGLSFKFQYAALGLAAVVYGPFTGAAVALLGEVLLAAWGAGFWWSVIAASVAAGFVTGVLCNRRYLRSGGFHGGAMARYILGSLAAHAIAWLVVCPALDLLFYREALDNLIRRGAFTAVASGLVAIVAGGLLCAVFSGLLPWQRDRSPA
ncbi:ECF transporter S component [Ruminococcaceae bacterium OttesenSCG-928-D13]|nr:ECF transporter S component [Ruminococcaceae bacterium OttesenSCG-928-D13]